MLCAALLYIIQVQIILADTRIHVTQLHTYVCGMTYCEAACNRGRVSSASSHTVLHASTGRALAHLTVEYVYFRAILIIAHWSVSLHLWSVCARVFAFELAGCNSQVFM